MNTTPVMQLRPARPADVDAIATIWRTGWIDGHAGHVPSALADHRSESDLARLAAARVDDTTVAVVEGEVVGFVTVHDDELEQVYVAGPARGTGVVSALLHAGERAVARHHRSAWLAVVAGNVRARRCYERHGWRDAGAFTYAADTGAGSFAVPAHRYVKTVAGASR
ncbi:GNAT family N-acetyltransferase [Desertimonas flava]|uniref:GNAT family N-acetyltransferase n=1 Tax=Desertimonas flava TaxID=2064846 RepID=UPI000E352E88|nr:GNAT family N-acetyltransferase [Desertimonas flava]